MDEASDSRDLAAIDVHAHCGPYRCDGLAARCCAWMSGDLTTVAARARQANTELTFVSPLDGLMPRGRACASRANAALEAQLQKGPGQAARPGPVRRWVIVHPDEPTTHQQARVALTAGTAVGIKLHPEEHQYPIAERGNALFELAAELGAVVLTHSGDALSRPADFVPFADRYPHLAIILGHLGNGGAAAGPPDLQVGAAAACRNANLFVDTSSARSLLPGLLEWAVGELGAERLLYGTDSPLYFAPMQRARIDHADLPLAARRRILRDNAVALFGLQASVGHDHRPEDTRS